MGNWPSTTVELFPVRGKTLYELRSDPDAIRLKEYTVLQGLRDQEPGAYNSLKVAIPGMVLRNSILMVLLGANLRDVFFLCKGGVEPACWH